MRALISQLKNMKDDELLNAYQAMVEKVGGILLSLSFGDMGGFALVDKLKRIKKKYSFVEREIEKRKLKQTLSISSINTTDLEDAETEKLNALIKRYKYERYK